ncbi:MAG: DUF3793 family protein [Herbinix sp.]|nr:DUF3793 family protein [Herbinix sp.]
MDEKQFWYNRFENQSNRKIRNQTDNSNNVNDYVKYLLANFCTPTLLKIKPSSFVRMNMREGIKKCILLKTIETEIKQFECQYYILYENENIINLLIYNEELFLKILDCKENKQFFRTNGFEIQDNSIKEVLHTLKQRFELYYSQKAREQVIRFPHEIGIILGYPLLDVEDFVRYNGKDYQICGYWKVYHNAEEALKIFESYKRMRRYAIDLIMEGKDLNNLLLDDFT